MKAKRCPLCGGKPKFMHYAIPAYKHPDGWEETEDGPEPMILAKRLECTQCNATVPFLVLICDDAIKAWNEDNIVQFIQSEDVMEVEDEKP